MSKLVTLNIVSGEFEGGFEIVLRVEKGGNSVLSQNGQLPPAPKIPELYDKWRYNYCEYKQSNRRSRGKIIHRVLIPNPKEKAHISIVNSAKLLEEAINGWLNSGEQYFQPIRDELLQHICNKEEPLQFIIQTDNQKLWRLPWHLWSILEQSPHTEVALSLANPGSPDSDNSLEKGKKVRILAILGNSEGIDVAADRRQLELIPDAETTFLVEPERKEINDRLWEQNWDILFFAGHSNTEEDTGKIFINARDSLSVKELRYGLQKAIKRGLKLAIFNSCDGLGLARRLSDLNLPYTIVMREPVPDRVAQEFAKCFLQNFSQGEPFHLAVKEARQRLQGLEDKFPCASWLPVICQNPAEHPPSWQDFLQSPPPPAENKEMLPEATVAEKVSSVSWQGLGQRLGALLATSLVSTGAVMGLRWFGALQPLELLAYDYLMQQRKAEPIDPRLVVVEVTQEDANQYGYPLDDDILVRAIDSLERGEPAAIGLNMHRYQARGQGREDLIAQFEQNPNLLLVCTSLRNNKLYEPPPEFSAQQLKRQVGFSDLVVDRPFDIKDTTVRRQLLYYETSQLSHSSACTAQYSFSLQLTLRFLSAKGIPAKVTARKERQFGSAVFQRLASRAGGYQQLDGLSNQVLLNYRANPKPALAIGLADILEGRLNSSHIKGRIVLIGHSSDMDKRFDTPVGKLDAVWVHAHQVSHILSAAMDERPLLWVLPQWGDFQWGDWLWVWVWAATGSLLAIRWRSPLYLVLAAGAVTLILYQVCLTVLIFGGWMPLIPSALALLVAGSSVACTSSITRR